MHHFPVLENLRRRKAIGTKKWLEEQKHFWENEWYRCAWLWFQKKCENQFKNFKEESKALHE